MNLDEALTECCRFLEKCDETRDRVAKTVEISRRVRDMEISQNEARTLLRKLDESSPKVYSAEKLEKAIRFLTKEAKKWKTEKL